MLKVLIAEDEYLVRQMLKMAIPWEECGFYIAEEADNGKQVMEKIAQVKPDLLLLDINMPVINGIEIAKIVSEQYPELIMVIVTGYDVFEYAQKAISYGVCDYLLKPVRNDILLNTVLKCKQRAYERRAMAEAIPGPMGSFLLRWLSGQSDAKELDPNLSELTAVLKPEHMMCFTIEIDNAHQIVAERSDPVLRQYLAEAIQVLRHTAEKLLPNSVFLPVSVKRAAGILSSEQDMEMLFHEYFNEVMQQVRKGCNFTITVGVSNESAKLDDLPQLYKSSQEAVTRKFFIGKNRIIRPTDLPEARLETVCYSDFPKEKLSLLIRSGKITEIRELVRKHTDALRKMPFLTVSQACWQCSDMLSLETHKLFELSADQSEMYLLETIDELEDWIVHMMYRLSEEYQKDNAKLHSIVEASTKYVSEHYWDPELSVEVISQKLFVSASYLSRIFKKHYATGLNEFIHDLRMSKAMELVKTSEDLKMNDVSNLVGYRDPLYFSKCFKKQFGISFSEWKKAK
jgi:two-component system response regulator YesN